MRVIGSEAVFRTMPMCVKQADQPSADSGASAGQKRPAAAADLLPDPRLLQRSRVNAGRPTPKQYRPEPPNRKPAASAAALAPASRLSAAANAVPQPLPTVTSIGGSVLAGAQQSAVPGLETITTSGNGTGAALSAPSRLPQLSPSSTAPFMLPPASVLMPAAMEPPGLEDGRAPSRAPPVLSYAGLSPGKGPMQRAAVNALQPASKQLPPPSWLPAGQRPSQQQQRQRPQRPSHPAPGGATHHVNGISSTAGKGPGAGGVASRFQHGQQQQAASLSRQAPSPQHQQSDGRSPGRGSTQPPNASLLQQPDFAARTRTPGRRPFELPPDVTQPLHPQQVSLEPSTLAKGISS